MYFFIFLRTRVRNSMEPVESYGTLVRKIGKRLLTRVFPPSGNTWPHPTTFSAKAKVSFLCHKLLPLMTQAAHAI